MVYPGHRTASVLATTLATVLGATLLLAWFAPQAQGQNGEGGSGEERTPEALKKDLAERGEKLSREQTAPAAAESGIDQDPEGNPYVAGELIVAYREQVSREATRATRQKVTGEVRKKLPRIKAEVVSVPEVKAKSEKRLREEALEDKKRILEADPNVESVDYNYARERRVNDPYSGSQWGLSRIRAPQAWYTSKGVNAKIAIVDGGAQANHPDIRGAVVDEYNYYDGTAAANDEDGHGTHVSGIAAARTNNSVGIAGTAPAASLFNYDVCGPEYCDDASIIGAITDAADLGADAVNMSLGGAGYSASGDRAVNYAWNKGVVLVAAAGNESTSTPSYPAAYGNVIAVSSVNYAGAKSNFSNYGSYVDVAAPGGSTAAGTPYKQEIVSSVPTYVNSGGYDYWSGTSMATPFVSGIAGLLAAQNLTGVQIRQRIENTATDLGATGKDIYYGKGLVNAQAAVTNDTAPSISGFYPANGSSTTNKRPAVGATVRDSQNRLAAANVRLYVDNVRKTGFTYDPASGKLNFSNSTNYAVGVHSVKVIATDPQGMAKTATWSFSVR